MEHNATSKKASQWIRSNKLCPTTPPPPLTTHQGQVPKQAGRTSIVWFGGEEVGGEVSEQEKSRVHHI